MFYILDICFKFMFYILYILFFMSEFRVSYLVNT